MSIGVKGAMMAARHFSIYGGVQSMSEKNVDKIPKQLPNSMRLKIPTVSSATHSNQCNPHFRKPLSSLGPMDSLEEYSKRPIVQESAGGDEKKIKEAYDKYCQMMRSREDFVKKGINPSLML